MNLKAIRKEIKMSLPMLPLRGPKGRPPCEHLCCKNPETIRVMYEEGGLSSDQIAKELNVSDTHIVQQLRKMGVKMRNRWFYNQTPNRGGRGKRTNPLWNLTDEELFHIPAEMLAERMGVQKHSVFRIRWRRRKGELTTTITKPADESSDNILPTEEDVL